MEVQILSHAVALSPGSPLWILPTQGQSRWVNTVDWYLNFQWSRAQHHTAQSLAPEMYQIAKENGFSVYYTPPSGGHLMILSKRLLPNDQTVFVESPNLTEWLKQAHKIWQGLAQPAVRLFLPRGAAVEQVQESFSRALENKNLTVVLDRGES